MNKQDHKKSIKTFLSIVGIASVSIFMSFPTFAQTTPTPSNRDSSTRNQQMNGTSPTDAGSMQQQTPSSQQMNTGTSGTQSTDGQRLPTDDRSMQQQNTGSQQINTGSTTTETQIRRTTSQEVSPGSTTTTPAATPTTTPAATPTDTSSPTPTTQEKPDQGVRALW